jgi:hypothetical protein
MPGPRITDQEALARGRTGLKGDAICPVGGIIWGEVWRMGCGGDSRTPWRGKTRGKKTRHRQAGSADHGPIACCRVSRRMKIIRPW